MPDYYLHHPALKPTVLIHEVTKTVYRPSGARELSQDRPDAIEAPVARETSRAA